MKLYETIEILVVKFDVNDCIRTSLTEVEDNVLFDDDFS